MPDIWEEAAAALEKKPVAAPAKPSQPEEDIWSQAQAALGPEPIDYVRSSEIIRASHNYIRSSDLRRKPGYGVQPVDQETTDLVADKQYFKPGGIAETAWDAMSRGPRAAGLGGFIPSTANEAANYIPHGTRAAVGGLIGGVEGIAGAGEAMLGAEDAARSAALSKLGIPLEYQPNNNAQRSVLRGIRQDLSGASSDLADNSKTLNAYRQPGDQASFADVVGAGVGPGIMSSIPGMALGGGSSAVASRGAIALGLSEKAIPVLARLAGSASEAMTEAGSSYGEVYDKAIQDGKTDQEADQLARTAAVKVGAANLVYLGLKNELGGRFGFDPEARVYGEMAQNAIGKAKDAFLKKLGDSKVLKALGILGEGAMEYVSEGHLEEQVQKAFSNMAEKGLPFTWENFKQEYLTREAWLEGVTGGISGLLMGTGNKVLEARAGGPQGIAPAPPTPPSVTGAQATTPVGAMPPSQTAPAQGITQAPAAAASPAQALALRDDQTGVFFDPANGRFMVEDASGTRDLNPQNPAELQAASRLSQQAQLSAPLPTDLDGHKTQLKDIDQRLKLADAELEGEIDAEIARQQGAESLSKDQRRALALRTLQGRPEIAAKIKALQEGTATLKARKERLVHGIIQAPLATGLEQTDTSTSGAENVAQPASPSQPSQAGPVNAGGEPESQPLPAGAVEGSDRQALEGSGRPGEGAARQAVPGGTPELQRRLKVAEAIALKGQPKSAPSPLTPEIHSDLDFRSGDRMEKLAGLDAEPTQVKNTLPGGMTMTHSSRGNYDIALPDGKGQINTVDLGDQLFVRYVGVDPELRGQGKGRELLETAARIAKRVNPGLKYATMDVEGDEAIQNLVKSYPSAVMSERDGRKFASIDIHDILTGNRTSRPLDQKKAKQEPNLSPERSANRAPESVAEAEMGEGPGLGTGSKDQGDAATKKGAPRAEEARPEEKPAEPKGIQQEEAKRPTREELLKKMREMSGQKEEAPAPKKGIVPAEKKPKRAPRGVKQEGKESPWDAVGREDLGNGFALVRHRNGAYSAVLPDGMQFGGTALNPWSRGKAIERLKSSGYQEPAAPAPPTPAQQARSEADAAKAKVQEGLAKFKKAVANQAKGQANMGLPLSPEVLEAGADLVMALVEAGYKSFKAMALEIAEGLGSPEEQSAFELAYDAYRTFDDSLPARGDGETVASYGEKADIQDGGAQDAQANDAGVAGGERPGTPGETTGPGESGGLAGSTASEVGGDRGEEGGAGAPAVAGPGVGQPGGHALGRPGAEPAAEGRVPGAGGRSQAQPVGKNYDIKAHGLSSEDLSTVSGKKKAAKANIEAIRVLKTLEAEGRGATLDEQKALARFVGWGALDKAVDSWRARMADTLPEDQKDKAQKQWEKDWLETHRALAEVLTDEEMRRARSSILNAHYTSTDVVAGIWDVLQKLGMTGGKALEPSAGIGNFIGLAPKDAFSWSAIELEPMTAGILRQLYPEAQTFNAGFQDATPAGQFDLVISNFPFSKDVKLPHGGDLYPIHDYFFLQGLDHLRPGGVMAAITSHYTMDKLDRTVRSKIIQNADLVAAIRLPNTAFEANAGTQVVTDVIFLRKLEEPRSDDEMKDIAGMNAAFLGTGQETLTNRKGEQATVNINNYYRERPGRVLGTPALGGLETMDQLTILPLENAGTLSHQMDTSLFGGDYKLRQGTVFTPGEPGDAGLEVKPPAKMAAHAGQKGNKPGSYVQDGDQIRVLDEDGKLAPVVIGSRKIKGQEEYEPVHLENPSREQIETLKHYQATRDAFAELVDLERDPNASDAEIESARKALNDAYDALVKPREWKAKTKAPSFLSVETPKGQKHPLRWLKNDIDYWSLASLEVLSKDRLTASKQPIFSQRVLRPVTEPGDGTINDMATAYSSVMAWRGRLDMDWISRKTGASHEAIAEELRGMGLAFFDPEKGALEPAFLYLSGNVRKKLEAAKKAGLQENVDRLEKVQPVNRSFEEFSVTPTSSWVSDETVNRFMLSRLGIGGLIASTDSIGGKRNFQVTDASRSKSRFSYRSGNTETDNSQFATRYFGTKKILEATFNGKHLTAYDEDPDTGERFINQAETDIARGVQRELANAYREWAAENQRIFEDEYNQNVNHTAPVEWPVPDVTRYPNANENIKLEDFQKRVVERGLIQNTLLAHVVGAGKTFSMVTIAAEAKRRGLARKPLIVALNEGVPTIVSQAQTLYPGMKILSAQTGATPEERRRFIHLARNQDWDLVVLPMSVFNMIGDSEGSVTALIQEMEQELEDVLRNITDKRERKRTQKKAQAKIDKLRDALLKQAKRDTDRGLPLWEDMGVDWLMADEVHKFKKLGFSTQLNIRGVDTSRSQTAFSLFVKSKAVKAAQDGEQRGLIFATGTPVSNTVAELWTWGRFLDQKGLEEFGVKTFDHWVGTFARVEPRNEYTATLEWKTYDKLAKYENPNEFLTWFSNFADRVGPDQIKRTVLPEPIGGRQIKNLKPSPQTLDVILSLAERLKNWYNLSPALRREKSAEPLVVEGLSVGAAIDTRLVDPSMPNDPSSKLNVGIRDILEVLKDPDLKEKKAVVAVMLDRYRSPNPESGEGREMGLQADQVFNAHHWIRDELVRNGIPADQIHILTDGTKQQNSEAVDKANDGDIRVLVGTTEKGGTGLNFQQHLYALFHFDLPQRASDLIQREGRIIRSGNLFDKVLLRVYGTERTMDTKRAQAMLTKVTAFNQFMYAQPGTMVSEFEDISTEDSFSYNDMIGAFSGDTRVLEKADLEREIKELKDEKRGYDRATAQARAAAAWAVQEVENLQKRADAAEAAAKGVAPLMSLLQGVQEGTQENPFREYEVKETKGEDGKTETTRTEKPIDILSPEAAAFRERYMVKVREAKGYKISPWVLTDLFGRGDDYSPNTERVFSLPAKTLGDFTITPKAVFSAFMGTDSIYILNPQTIEYEITDKDGKTVLSGDFLMGDQNKIIYRILQDATETVEAPEAINRKLEDAKREYDNASKTANRGEWPKSETLRGKESRLDEIMASLLADHVQEADGDEALTSNLDESEGEEEGNDRSGEAGFVNPDIFLFPFQVAYDFYKSGKANFPQWLKAVRQYAESAGIWGKVRNQVKDLWQAVKLKYQTRGLTDLQARSNLMEVLSGPPITPEDFVQTMRGLGSVPAFRVGDVGFKVSGGNAYVQMGESMWQPVENPLDAQAVFQAALESQNTADAQAFINTPPRTLLQMLTGRSAQGRAIGKNFSSRFERSFDLPSRLEQKYGQTIGWVFRAIDRWHTAVTLHESRHAETRRGWEKLSGNESHDLFKSMAKFRFQEPTAADLAKAKALLKERVDRASAQVQEAEAAFARADEAASKALEAYKAAAPGDRMKALGVMGAANAAKGQAVRFLARRRAVLEEAKARMDSASPRGRRLTDAELKAQGFSDQAVQVYRDTLYDYHQQITELANTARLAVCTVTADISLKIDDLQAKLATEQNALVKDNLNRQITELEDQIRAAEHVANYYEELPLFELAYVPLVRVGNVAVKWFNKDGGLEGIVTGRTTREVRKKAEAALKEWPDLAQFKMTDPIQMNDGRSDFAKSPTLEDLQKAARIAGLDPKDAMDLTDAYEALNLQERNAKGFKVHLRHAEGLPGYEVNGPQAHAIYTQRAAKYKAHMDHGRTISRRISALEEVHTQGASKNTEAVGYLKKLAQDVFNNPVSSSVVRFNQIADIVGLGGNLGFMIPQMAQKLTHELPVLRSIWRGKPTASVEMAAFRIASAMIFDRNISPESVASMLQGSVQGDADALAKEVLGAMKRAEDEGAFIDEQTQETRNAAAGYDYGTRGDVERGTHKVHQAFFTLIRHSELHNRRQTFIASYLLGRTLGFPAEEGFDPNQEPDKIGRASGKDYTILNRHAAYVLGEKMVDWIHNKRGATNRSEILRAHGGIYGIPLKFKYFQFEYPQMISRLFEDEMARYQKQGMTSRQAATKALVPVMQSQAILLALGGMMGPWGLASMLDWLDWLWNDLLGPLVEGKGFKSTNAFNWRSWGWMPKVLKYGVPSLGGFNISLNVGMGDQLAFKRGDSAKDTFWKMTGATPGMIQQALDRGRPLDIITPKGVSQAVRAVSEDKLHPGNGYTVPLTPGERAMMAVGIKPQSVAEAQDLAQQKKLESLNKASERKAQGITEAGRERRERGRKNQGFLRQLGR